MGWSFFCVYTICAQSLFSTTLTRSGRSHLKEAAACRHLLCYLSPKPPFCKGGLFMCLHDGRTIFIQHHHHSECPKAPPIPPLALRGNIGGNKGYKGYKGHKGSRKIEGRNPFNPCNPWYPWCSPEAHPLPHTQKVHGYLF